MRTFLSSSVHRAQFAPPPPDFVDVRVVAANTAERHTIPTGARYVIFSGNADFYTKFGNSGVTAAVPSGDVTDGSGSELNPEAREIGDATHVSIISASAAIITMSFYG